MNMSERQKREIDIQVDAQDLSFQFRLSRNVPAGTYLRLRAASVTAMRAVQSIAIRAGGRALATVQRFEVARMKQDFNWFIRHLSVVTVEVSDDLAAGSQIEVAVVLDGFATDRSAGCTGKAAPYSGLTWCYSLVSASGSEADASEWQEVAAPICLELVPGPCAAVAAVLRPNRQLAIQAFDAFNNPVCSDRETVAVNGQEVVLSGSRPVTLFSCAESRAELVRADGSRVLSSAKPVGFAGQPVFFGEFHWHTDFSGDGQRSMSDALTSARDELCLDFAGPADHLGRGIHYKKRSIEDQRDICASFDEPGRFVTLPTYERSEREGHVNIIADSWDVLRQVAETTDRERYPADRFPLEELVNACPPGRAVIVPHHPNMDSHTRERVVNPKDGRPYWCRMDWGPEPELQATRLVEIHQQRGSFEAEEPDPEWRIDVGGYGSSVRTALARGYRLGFTGGTDNHCGWPTRCPHGWCGLTGVQADELTLPSIFEALYSRRCYATSGARIVGDFRCGENPMGSEIEQAPGQPRTFEILVRGTAPLVAVQIISCGAVLADLPVEPDSPDLNVTWSDERPGRPLRDVYYYVRARQTDGHCIWFSPIWFDLAAPKGRKSYYAVIAVDRRGNHFQ